MSLDFSYRHLYYFWVVAKEGGISRAAERLGMAVQTIGTQVRELEKSLGHCLLRPAGRGLALTEAGVAALRQADLIFQLGEQLPDAIRAATEPASVRLSIGVSDALTKLVVNRLMQPVMLERRLRLLCQVDEFGDLLADLTLHRLDAVLADQPAPSNPNLRLYSHELSRSGLAWFAPETWATQAADGFPESLSKVPVLLPTRHAAVRAGIDRWFEQLGIHPYLVGEFEDAALLKTFGANGMGVFPASSLVQDEIVHRYGVTCIGPCHGVEEIFFLIGTEKRIDHPLVQRLVPTCCS
jgi:LysR family transcriptional regulator, transcriptional activator of nhaA